MTFELPPDDERCPACDRPWREHGWRADDEVEDSLHPVCPSGAPADEGERET